MKTFNEYIKENYPNSVFEGNNFLRFTKFEDELSVLKNGVGLKVSETASLIKLAGKDTIDFLHRVSTNDLISIKPFTKRNTLFLNEKGRFIAKSTLLSFLDENWLLSDFDPANRIFSWLNKFIISEDIKTEDVSLKYSLLELTGPQAESFIMLLIGDEVSKISPEDFRRFDADGFTFYLFRSSEKANCNSTKIIIESDRLVDFTEHLFSIKSVFDISLVGRHALDTYRIEKLIPAFPNELNAEVNPHDVNLLSEICTTKGCYIGQEVIARLETYDKVQRKLVKIISAQKIEEPSKVVYNDSGEEVGEITTHGVYTNSTGYASLCLLRKKMLLQNSNYHILLNNKKVSIKIAAED
ncbi:MAG: aminomethyl transferase glycine cleavage T protein [Ignavibacteria bacterium]|nr:MAG: aminomethyl transferase glycine cleavage T protein [Ignavibacteria bacterium]KAF0160984.1 MAG: aminomethyl transferase glycine cleavage T protein [Ignavibacteria bacterium]